MMGITDVAKRLVFDDKGCFGTVSYPMFVTRGDADIASDCSEVGVDFEKRFVPFTPFDLF
jgi:hypothetical protein